MSDRLLLSPEQATAQASSEYNYSYANTAISTLYRQSWKKLDAAYGLLQHQIDGVHELVDPFLPQELTHHALDDFADIARDAPLTYDTVAMSALTVVNARPFVEWACYGRATPSDDTTKVYDEGLASIVDGIELWMEHYGEDAVRTGEVARDNVNAPLGFIFESMVMGLIAESKAFRAAHIYPMPAPPRLEQVGKRRGYPIDVMLLHIDEQGSSEMVGGIQCESIRSSRRNLPKDHFTVNLIARSDLATRASGLNDIIQDWLDEKRLGRMHFGLRRAIIRSENTRLLDLLSGTD